MLAPCLVEVRSLPHHWTRSSNAARRPTTRNGLARADSRTTILIAHRLSTVIDAGQVAIVEDGRVVEVGAPDDLIAHGGRFAELYGHWLAGAA
jgi:ATP-binding cassette, subfamily B, bacterial